MESAHIEDIMHRVYQAVNELITDEMQHIFFVSYLNILAP